MRAFVCCFCLLAACQPLDRTSGLIDGSVRFTVRDSAGAPVAGAIAVVDGTQRMSTSGEDGVVQVSGLLAGDHVVRVFSDDDGNGTFDRGALVLGHIEKTVVGNVIGERFTSDLPEDPGLEVLGALSGNVDCGTDLCRVVVFREIEVGGRTTTGPVEASSGVDTQGDWNIPDVLPGAVKVAVFAWARPAETAPLQQMIAASRPTRFAVADAEVAGDEVADVSFALIDTPASSSTTLVLGGDPAELEKPAGSAFFVVPQSDLLDVNAELTGAVAEAVVAVDVPVGVFDVEVTLDGGSFGRVLHAVAVPDLPALPLLQVGPDVPCPTINEKPDCDGDRDEDDDDDDGDGQADADEPSACRGVGRGTDLDGDCLCEPADPIPGCASNDPVDCAPAEPLVCD